MLHDDQVWYMIVSIRPNKMQNGQNMVVHDGAKGEGGQKLVKQVVKAR